MIGEKKLRASDEARSCLDDHKTLRDRGDYDPACGTASRAAGVAAGRAGSSGSAGGSAKCLIRRLRCGLNAVPAGIRCPRMTFSFRPTSMSTAPARAASVSTLVVSWKLAAEMNDSLCRDALVMPSSSVLPRAGRGFLDLAGSLPAASAPSLASLYSDLRTT